MSEMKSIDGESKEDNEAADFCRQLRAFTTAFAGIIREEPTFFT